jgi:hypothetical protein
MGVPVQGEPLVGAVATSKPVDDIINALLRKQECIRIERDRERLFLRKFGRSPARAEVGTKKSCAAAGAAGSRWKAALKPG